MGRVSIEESTLTAIGDSIRAKTGKADMIPPLSMPAEIASIQGGGGDAIIKTVEGACPITLEGCAEGNLLDYKIYGAVGGVGIKSKNLFDVETYGDVATWPISSSTRYLEIYVGTGSTVTVSHKTDYGADKGFYMTIGYDPAHKGSTNGSWMYHPVGASLRNKTVTVTTTGDYVYINCMVNSIPDANAVLADEFMVEISPVKTDYEPFGCSLPVKVSDNTLEFSIGKSLLFESDYLDYENRCVVKSDGTKTYLDLPEIPLVEGTNTFDVDTTVKPSNVSLTYVKSVEFNTMKTVEGTLPLTVEGVGQRLEDYKIYGNNGDTQYYGENNEYIGYDYITTNQNSSGATNKAGFNSGIKWNEVNRFKFSIRNNASQENNMIFAAKSTNENVCSALNSPWIGIGQTAYQSNSLTGFSYDNHPDPGVFGIDTLNFNTPTSTNYIWVASWMDGSWSRNNDWGFVEFYKDNTLVAAFYPAKRISDGVFGFYNTVSGVFIACGANPTAFVGNAELSNSVGDLYGNHYIIPVNINGNVINIESPSFLGINDYIDFENRVIVKEGVATYLNLPEINLQNGQNIIDVDTTVKPSKMSVSFVDNDGGYDAGYAEGYEAMKLAIDMSDVTYRFNETVTTYPGNWYRMNINFTDANGVAYKQIATYTSSGKINIQYVPVSGSAVAVYSGGNSPMWSDEAYRTIHITDGAMTGDLETFRWLINNGQFNPAQEG